MSTGSTTTSTPVVLNWRDGWFTNVLVTASSSFACDFTVEYTLDDLMLVGGASAATWSAVSSVAGQPATHFLSSLAYPMGVSYAFPGPVAAVRLGSTAQTAMGAGNTLSMKVIQGSE